jgi:fructan beta-fructosidase
MEVSGFKGRGLVNTFFKGDDTTGTLTSPEFRIERKFIAFLIGGGKNPEKLALQLLVDGQVVRSATGPNDQPGGSEALAPESWDVSEFAGKMATSASWTTRKAAGDTSTWITSSRPIENRPVC